MKTSLNIGALALLFMAMASHSINAQEKEANEPFRTITFESKDGLEITADLYNPHEDISAPFIVLCHQAGWSRGEYREIAPKLNAMGFNCMAIDQRSGGAVNDVDNETLKKAKEAEKKTTFVDAEQDMIAAVEFAREEFADGKVILWGSSYSSALALLIAGNNEGLVDGVMAFAPGEYFERFERPGRLDSNCRCQHLRACLHHISAKRV